jgi:cytochrome P450
MFDRKISGADEAVMQRLNEKGIALVKEFKKRLEDGTQCLPGQSQELLERSFLYVMLQADVPLEEVAGSMINTFLAASEGPAGGLALLLQELAHNKGVQDTLAAELASVGGVNAIGAVKLGELPYLGGTTLEGLRLFAPVTLVQRQSVVDTELDGHFVPKNTVVGVCAAAVHRSEEHYTNSSEFDPTRYLFSFTFHSIFFTFLCNLFFNLCAKL